MSQTVWPLNENGEIVFSAGTGSSSVVGYLNQDVLPSNSDGSVPVVLVGNQRDYVPDTDIPLHASPPTVTHLGQVATHHLQLISCTLTTMKQQ